MKAKYISRNLKLVIVLYWVVLILLKAGELIFQQPVKALTIEIETTLIKTFVSMLLFSLLPPFTCMSFFSFDMDKCGCWGGSAWSLGSSTGAFHFGTCSMDEIGPWVKVDSSADLGYYNNSCSRASSRES